MPRAANSMPKPPTITPGAETEIRVAQAWFWEGNFARRGISLKHHYQTDSLEVTDLDLLAIELTSTLEPHKYIGESKSGKATSAAKPLDRIIWLRGLMDLLGDISGAELTTVKRPPNPIVDLAAPLCVIFQSVEDLERRELRLRMETLADYGSQGREAFLIAKRVQATVKEDPELDRAFWLLRSEIWFLDKWMGIKRLLAAIDAISKRWSPKIKDESGEAVSWLLAEAVGVFSLFLIMASAPALRLSPSEFMAFAANHLADSGVDPRRMRQLSDAIDKYVAGLLNQAKAPRALMVESMGAFAPSAPLYTEALAETARRLTSRVDIARSLPRYMDLIAHERLVRQREPGPVVVSELDGGHVLALARASRILLAFLAGNASLPQPVVDLLGRPPMPAVLRVRTDEQEARAVAISSPVTVEPNSQETTSVVPAPSPDQGQPPAAPAPEPAAGIAGIPVALPGMRSSGEEPAPRPGLWSLAEPESKYGSKDTEDEPTPPKEADPR